MSRRYHDGGAEASPQRFQEMPGSVDHGPHPPHPPRCAIRPRQTEPPGAPLGPPWGPWGRRPSGRGWGRMRSCKDAMRGTSTLTVWHYARPPNGRPFSCEHAAERSEAACSSAATAGSAAVGLQQQTSQSSSFVPIHNHASRRSLNSESVGRRAGRSSVQSRSNESRGPKNAG